MRRYVGICAVISSLAVALAGIAVAGSRAGIERDVKLRFLDVRGQVEFLDLDPQAESEFDPSPGDTFFFANTLRDAADTRDVGRFLSKCVALFGTEFKCSGTLLLPEGTIELAATPDFASGDPIKGAVIGGTRRYLNVGGQFTITATGTEGVSELVVKLIAIH